jgi:hypothetical protein
MMFPQTLLGRIPAPHLLAAALCTGLTASLAQEVRGNGIALLAALLASAALAVRECRAIVLAGAVLLAGWWAGSLRLAALDRSVLVEEVGRVAQARLEVTGPARLGPFAVRVPVRVLRFGELAPDERARLDLPRGRAPPQGAIVEVVAEIKRPRGREDDDFDESSYLRRQGIHVVLSGDGYRVVGRRGGLGGLADSLRALVARGLAPGVTGERRAVIAGIILGEDEGIEQGLRDRFRASGLYHLLKKSIKGKTLPWVASPDEAREPTPAPQHVDGDRTRCGQGARVLHRQPGVAPAGRCCGSPLDGRTCPAVATPDGGTPTRSRLRARGARNAPAHGAPARHRHRAKAATATAQPAPFLLVARISGCPDYPSLVVGCIPTPLGLSERSFSASIPETSRACSASPPCPPGFRAVGVRA